MTHIYFIANIFILFLFLYSFNRGKSTEKACIILSCVTWALLFGLRAYTVGNDTPNYAAYYENRNTPYIGYGTVDHPGDSIEWGFVAITRLLHTFSHSASFFFLVVAITLFFGIYKIYQKEAKSNATWCFLLLTITGLTFIGLISMMRQTMSISALLLSIYFFYSFQSEREKNWKCWTKNMNLIFSISCAIISILIHRTSIMLFGGLLLLLLWKNNRKISFIAIISSFVISIFYGNIISNTMDIVLNFIGSISDDKIALLGNRYEDTMHDTAGSSLIRRFSYLIPVLVTIKYTEDKDLNSFCFKCMLVAFIGLFCFSVSYMMNRLVTVYLVLGMCKFVPPLAMKKGSKLHFFYISVTLYYLWRIFVAYENWPVTDSILPYYFFWQQ